MLFGLSIGANLVLLALTLFVLVLAVVASRRYSNKAPLATLETQNSNVSTGSSDATDAILMVRSGGRVDYINDRARDWFELNSGELPDLERLLRRARPSDEFFSLCIEPGQKRISVGNKLVVATSYLVPGQYSQMFIVLQPVEFSKNISDSGGDSSILRLVSDFGRDISSSLRMDDMLHAILLNVSQLVPSDILEIKFFNSSSVDATIFTLPADGDAKTQTVPVSQFGEITKQLIETRQPILLGDMSNLPANLSHINDKSTVRSYLGIPLIADKDIIGTLELGHLITDALGQHDLDLLQLLSTQIAFGLRNAVKVETQEKMAAQFAGLANLSVALVGSQDFASLNQRLVSTVSSLFSVDVMGVLLYDEGKRALEAQSPFLGLPSHIVDIYRTTITINSPAEMVIQQKKSVVTANAASDPDFKALGLQTLAQAASLRESVLAPIVSGDKFSGYFQISNHKELSKSFTDAEVQLAETIAKQIANIIENSIAFEKTRQRALRSDALRRIASLAASSATLNEILQFSLQEIARLFQGDIAAIFMYDEQTGELNLHVDSVFGATDDEIQTLNHLHMDAAQYRYTVSGSQRPFLSGRLSSDRRVLPGYHPLVTTLQVESAVVVPVVVRDQSLGELMIGSKKAEFFNNFDLQIISTAAGQLANAIDDASRHVLTDDSMRQKIDQLTSIARLSRDLNSTSDFRALLEIVRDESLRATRADCGNVLIFDQNASTEKPSILISTGCSLSSELSDMDIKAIKSGQIEIIEDISKTQYSPVHPGANFVMVVPVVHRSRTLGLIHLHSDKASNVNEDALGVMQTLATQASVAIANAQRYQDLSRQSEQLQRRAGVLTHLSQTGLNINLELPLEQSLRNIALNISEATPFKAVLISVYESDTGLLRRIAGVGFPQDAMAELFSRKQPLASLQQVLKPQFRTNRTFFIPANQSPILPSDVHVVTIEDNTNEKKSPNSWDPDDTLITILEDYHGNPVGIISFDSPRDGLRPDRATIEALEIFAGQATFAILGTSRVADLRTQVETLSSGIERQQKLLSITQNDLPVMLRKDLDQTIAIQNLDQRSQRVRAGLAITESVSRQLDASSALQALARETLTQLGMSVAMIAEATNDGSRLTHILGNVPRATSPDALFGQKNPLRACLQTGEAILISTLDENLEWRETPLLTALRAKSLICLPIKIDNQPVAAMLAVSPEPMSSFTEEDLQVYYQIVRQTSVILQNISLLNETRRRLQEVNLLLDFSRQLRGLDADRIVKSLLDSARKALSSAHAGIVLIWDEHTSQLCPQAVSGYADNDSMSQITYMSGEALPGYVFETNTPMRIDEVQFTRDYTFSVEAQQLLYRQATGGRLPISSLLIPIQSGDQRVGVLVLDNFNTVSAFLEEDQTLLLSLTQQVGLSLQNVRLVHATRERAEQLEALTAAATNLTSNLQSTELIESLLDQLQPVITHDTATLWIREHDRLRVAAARGFPDTEQRLGLTIASEDSSLFKEMIRTGQGILIGDVRQDPRFPPLDAPRLSWLGLPMVSKNEVIGVLALEKSQSYFYTHEHLQVGTTFASQSAVALENARLFEDSVSRASELNERSQRLALLNRFSSSLSGLLDEEKILQLAAQELLDALSASRVSIVNFVRGSAMWIHDNPRPKVKLPRRIPDAPVFTRMKESLGVYTSESVKDDADLAPLESFFAELTRSVLILPFTSGSSLRALAVIHQNEQIHFSSNEIELARTLANQAAIALENARLYQSTRFTADRFATLNQASYQVGANLDPEQIYVAVHNAAKKLMPVESFVISLLDEATDEIEGVYLVDGDKRSPVTRIPRDQGLSGKVVSTGEPLLTHGSETADTMGGIAYGRSDAPQSILAVPMIMGSRAIGMLSAQSYQANVYTEDDLQILSTLANQAVVAIQNGRLFNETQRLAQELEQRVIDRTAELQREQQNTETLLRILTEVSSSLDLDRALNRTLALLNDAIGAEQGTIMLRSPDDSMLHYRAGYGYLSDKITGDRRGFKLKVGEGLAGWVVAHRDAALIPDLHQDPRWVVSSSSSNEHRSSMVVPLLVADDVIGVLMVFHRKINFFSAERLNMVKAIAGQVSVAINNAHLYELIRDQAERLGSMLRREQEDASRSQAILEAVADGVLVTGNNNRIAFLNNSAETILGLKASHVKDQPMDVFAGLFGKAAGSWMETIRVWSNDPSIYQAGDTYAEQLDLQNGRIVLVHLAPVILMDDFLGTVSIFRDITHEVEVDRLKSEFVATVSHELRTPMTSIRGYTDVLLMGAAGALNENQTHFLNIIKNNTERLNILVNDLLDVSQIEAGKITLSPQALDLREVAEEVMEEVLRRSQEENKSMALSLDVPKKLPLVYGDSERVRQVLSNLVFNAYHYTPENGTITVAIQSLNGGHEVQVDVNDNGVGIALEEQERLFERFYRGEHPLVLATPGTGLGLSIVKQIVEMHQGRIWMKSSGIPGEGSTFSFTLPVYDKNEA